MEVDVGEGSGESVKQKEGPLSIKGEGENAKSKNPTEKVDSSKSVPVKEEVVRNTKPVVGFNHVKKPSWWKQKFLGIPVWGWIVIVLIVAWAGVTVGIVAYR